jgi:triacylglycerol lipase
MAKTIVLAHGVLGFGNLGGLPTFVNYFNGVAAHLRRQGHTVFEPQVNPFGSIAQRGTQLASAISHIAAADPIHIIAHSMGGLDARHAITRVKGTAERVKSLVTIGTPHRGSPVATALADHTDPLFPHIPSFIVKQLGRNAGALHELTTGFVEHFDDTTPNVQGVRYINIAGDASRGGHELFLFQLAAIIAKFAEGEVNDGVVSRASALRPGDEHLEDWPVDHAGEVGWSLQTPVPIPLDVFGLISAPHLARYDDIVNRL